MTTGNRPANSRDTLTASPCRETTAAGPAAGEHELRTLSPEECFDLLEPGGVGRVGFASAAGVVILPVNFAVTEKTVVVRTAPDTQLAAYADGPVSFEVDHIDEVRHAGWSVLVQGRAHTVTEERVVKRLEDRTHLQPWAAGARDVYVRIVPNQISGRRI
jgi:nitroimidazol reductase NimA-like FMN-containing flavoprotein (pyridoxamine 5'-phosphate oxidase superfamily)